MMLIGNLFLINFGAMPFSALNVRTEYLAVILCLIGSQCNITHCHRHITRAVADMDNYHSALLGLII